jgi:regulatory protein SWI6
MLIAFADHSVEMTNLVQNLSTEFNSDIRSRQDQLDVTQAHLRAATRELSEQRKQIQFWQTRCTEVDQAEHQLRNLDAALAEEDHFDWTARTDLNGQDAKATAGPAFRWRGHPSTLPLPPAPAFLNSDVGDGSESPIPLDNSPEALIRLRRMKMWYDRSADLLDQRLQVIQGSSMLREFQCRKIVALCTSTPVDKVEQV